MLKPVMSIRLDMIGIVVKDIPTSLKFYRSLGIDSPEPEGGPYHQVMLDSGVRLSWNAESMMKELEKDWDSPVGQRVGMAFLCGTPAEVDALHAKLTGEGYEGKMDPWDAFWGQRYARVSDPDGNVVDIFCPLPA